MKKIVLIHYLPLEYYPPVTNMINYLSGELNNDIKLSVFSTHNTKNRIVFNNNKVKIFRTAQSQEDKNRLVRVFKYIYFQAFVLLKLIIIRPKKILYYESLSSFPVYLYIFFINRKAEIYIHYHEYTTPEQYATHSMAIERFFHKLEQHHIYKKANWISHTNNDRLKMFLNDNPSIDKNILKEMPNYPPKSWEKKIPLKKGIQNNLQLKCVYIGSLSLKNTYVEEFTKWVIAQNGKIYFDIFTYNLHLDTLNFLENLKSPYISFKRQGVEYSNIPLILKKYDVGIVFYKPYSNNVVNCISNKFYEYYMCNLDIWFSDIMKSTMQLTALKTKPRVIPINFSQLNSFNWEEYTNNKVIENNKSNYFCNDIYISIKERLEN